MKPDIVVGVPVLGRPQNVAPLLASVLNSGRYVEVSCLFIASPGDEEELAALAAAGADYVTAPWPPGPGDFARKHNYAIRKTSTEWYFAGADDLVFHPGWIEYALAAHLETGACVVGTNDLGNPAVMSGQHATHMLVNRDYLKCDPVVDAPGLLFCELYDHACCDNELVETAKARNTFAFAAASHVEHLHPLWGKGKQDSTYIKGNVHSGQDRALLIERRPLWS